MIRSRWILVCLVLLVLAASVSCKSVQGTVYRDMGNSAYYGGSEDVDRAIHLYEQAARYGDPEAQYRLGMIYLEGEDATRDTHRGLSLLEDAARLGYAPAERSLGILYLGGLHGMSRDLSKAESYLTSAARKNDVYAMLALGRLYSAHRQTQDFQAAARWYAAARRIDPRVDSKLEDPQYISKTVVLVKERKTFAGNGLVREVQRMLARLGYAPGPADGIAGKRTIRAVKQFQQDQGLEGNGSIDSNLLSALENAERAQ